MTESTSWWGGSGSTLQQKVRIWTGKVTVHDLIQTPTNLELAIASCYRRWGQVYMCWNFSPCDCAGVCGWIQWGKDILFEFHDHIASGRSTGKFVQ